jgi:hypothetical protein
MSDPSSRYGLLVRLMVMIGSGREKQPVGFISVTHMTSVSVIWPDLSGLRMTSGADWGRRGITIDGGHCGQASRHQPTLASGFRGGCDLRSSC